MADKEITSLPAAADIYDDVQLPCYVPGASEPAQKVTGAQIRELAYQAGKEGGNSLARGATYTPAVSLAGVMSWTNDQGLKNPAPVDLNDVLGIGPRRNLLHNWYFVNPINQRGKTVYTDGYCIDRWSGLRMEIEGGGISAADVVQIVGDYSLYAGNLVVLSVLTSEGIFTSNPVVVPTEITNPDSVVTLTSVSFDLRIDDNGVFNLGRAYVYLYGDGTIRVQLNGAVISYAIKLELGSGQTLARQDADGTWVLNEIPDYGEQLAICQRYQQVIAANTTVRASLITANFIRFLLPTPVEMRATPTISGTLVVRNASGATVSGFTFTAVNRKIGIEIQANKTAHGLTDACLLASTDVILDANL